MKINTLKQFAKLRAELELESASLQTRLKRIEAALGGQPAAQATSAPGEAPAKPKGRRKMSAAGRAAIAAAAKARWAKFRAGKPSAKAPAKAKGKRKMSAAGRAAIAAGAKARWARIRAAKAKAAK